MGKISYGDKMRIQTLCEQGWGYKKIVAAYRDKNWNLDSVKTVCRGYKITGSVDRKKGSGRPKSARTQAKVDQVAQLICSQEDQPGTSKSTRQIAAEVGISQRSVCRIAKVDLNLQCYKRTAAQVLKPDTKRKRFERCRALLRRLTVAANKRVFYTDEKAFYLDPPVNAQNNRLWATGRKSTVSANRLLVQRAKFSPHVMVSAGVCYGGRGRLHFVPDKAKINAAYYCNTLLPALIEDCDALLDDNFLFQQDGAPAHTTQQTQNWLAVHSPDFIGKDEWPPNSPDLNPMDYSIWGMMLSSYEQLAPKPTSKAELRTALQAIWDSLPQDSIDRAVLGMRKRLRACVEAEGGHFEHALR